MTPEIAAKGTFVPHEPSAKVVNRWPISQVCGEYGRHEDCAGKIGGADANHPVQWCGCPCHEENESEPSAPKVEPPTMICDCCGDQMLDRGGFWDCFNCGHNREKAAPEPVAGTQVEKDAVCDQYGFGTTPERVAGTASAPQDLLNEIRRQFICKIDLPDFDEFLRNRVVVSPEPNWPSLDSESGDFTDGWNQAIELCRKAFNNWAAPSVAGTPSVARCPKCQSTNLGILCRDCRKAGYSDSSPADFAQFFPSQPLRTPPAPAPEHEEYEYPPKIQKIHDRCEVNVVSFSNDDVSELLCEIKRLSRLVGK
jgi:hypothetical protein